MRTDRSLTIRARSCSSLSASSASQAAGTLLLSAALLLLAAGGCFPFAIMAIRLANRTVTASLALSMAASSLDNM